MKVKVSYSPNLSEVNEVDLTTETPTRGEWLIGRSPDSDLVLDSPDISRVHAKFFVKAGNYYFSDLGSRNGSIFNGKQAEKDRPYSLSDGDIIRIADYVLILEAVAPAYEQPETVFRIIDPSLFSRPRSPENVSAPNVVNPAPEVVSEVPAPITPEVETPSPEVSEISEVVANQPDDVIPVVEIIAPENIIQSPEAVSEVPHDVHDEIVDLQSVAPEVSADVEEVEIPEISENDEEVSFTLADDAIAAPENIIETSEEEITLPELTDDEVTDFQTALATESTFVQRRDTSSIPEPTDYEDAEFEAALEAEVTFVQPRDIFHQVPEATSLEDAELEAALEAEVTFVQPRDIFGEVSDEESTVLEVTHSENQVLDLDIPVAEEVSLEFGEFVNEVTEEEEIQPQETLSQPTQDINDELVDLDILFTPEDSTNIDEVEPSFAVDETGGEVAEALTEPDNIVAEVSSNQYIDLNNTTTEEASVNVDDVVLVSEVTELTDIQSLETTESEVPESISQTIEEVPEVEATQFDETPEEINVSEPPQVIIERNIVLIAHESKKSELAEFVSQHQEFFSHSFTITWPSVGEVLHQQAGITISQQTPAPISGGYQTIASLVGAGEILAVIFLRDLLQPQPGQANEEALLRLCTINQVLLATNLPTAEAIVHYLKHI
ncbi:FHA domain-containing protein [Nostoc sp. UCD121]|uniref:FHA domain-containing protein n=1 Tax=unclassified Nostoc TaxID=2593658 RepID=UPI001625E9BA|nr:MULTISPECIES: FHA domain-containing protein [unclassified Nostoc]MBC1222229.1 FHA domain-containing protein [Nostoc sp. UCD120]MBC1279403.1 FHA domain-containing protein [Nostoc sp. UCD121]MBC1295912.1 FHA domain-containing protein [Nostoc sp. UCD122]